jgi:hypothetical protein
MNARRTWQAAILATACLAPQAGAAAGDVPLRFQHTDTVWSLAYSPDGRLLASGGSDALVRVWDAETGRERHRCAGHRGRVSAVAFSPDGRLLASGSSDGNIFLWDTATGKRVGVCKGHAGWVLSVAFSADGKTLASGSYDETARLWDVATGQERRLFEGHEGPVSGVVLMPDGNTLVTAGFDSTLRVWNLDSGKLRHRTKRARRGELLGLTLAGDGSWVVSTSAVGALIRGRPESEGDDLWQQGSGGAGIALTCSADGKTLAVSNTTNVFLFETRTWERIGWLQVDDAPLSPREPSRMGSGRVRALALTPSGRELAVGQEGGRIAVWPLRSILAPERMHAWPLRSEDLPVLWERLADPNPAVAYRAAVTLASDPERSVPFLSERLPPAQRVEPERLRRLIGQLGDEDFAVRERATEELTKLMPSVEGSLRRAREDVSDLEVRTRLGRLLAAEQGGEMMRRQRIIMALEHAEATPAREMLRRLAAGAPGAALTDEAAAALRRLGPD